MLDRRVEITGPTDRKMVINALNCGASTFMADFEDANCPTWHNMIDGQINLRDAVRRSIALEQNGKRYRLNDKTAVLIPRPRGWHLDEKHVTVDGKPVSGGIFDFALYFFHNAKELLARGSGPYFYLPKMESHLEARLWNDIFIASAGRTGNSGGQHQGHGADRDGASPPSRWTRSCTSCASTRRASTSGAGTTSFPASRNSAPTRISASPTARR